MLFFFFPKTQQASEGYFSQSQEEEFAQSEELCAKAPSPVFYNKPPGSSSLDEWWNSGDRMGLEG